MRPRCSGGVRRLPPPHGDHAASSYRAALLAAIGLLAALAPASVRSATPASSTATTIPAENVAFQPRAVEGAVHTVIYRQAGQYSAFPILYQLPDQFRTLYVHFGAGESSSHVEPRREPMNFRSTDGGLTWGKTLRTEPNPAWASTPGRLVVPDAHGWRYVEAARRGEFESRGIEVRPSPDGRVTYASGCFSRTSDDGGQTWQEREIDVPPKGLIMRFLDPATYLRLADGSLATVYYLTRDGVTGIECTRWKNQWKPSR